MTERLDLFATPVLKASPPNADELNPQLLEVIAAQRKKHPGIERSNLGGWHSDTDMANWGGEASRELANFAVNTVSPHMVDVAKAGKRQFGWQVEMWANVNGPGHANQMHCHPASFWSGVYYPDPGGSEIEGNGGELLLEDPRYPMAHMMMPDLLLRDADSEPMYSQVAIRPVAGRIVLFPSWLRHSVRPHRGDRERVSIALNLALVDVKAVPGEP
jgi:uncharacterized protein (TIGR02466 family)